MYETFSTNNTTKHLLFSLVISFMVFLQGCNLSLVGTALLPDNDRTDTLTIYNVHLVDVANQQIKRNQTITITNGLIDSIEPTNENDRTERAIDGNGGYLTPGLIDMHVHAYEKSAFSLSLSHGVTHVRIMNGVPEHLEWKKQQQSRQWLASSMTVSTPIVRSGEQPLSWQAQTQQDAVQLVHKAKEHGYDVIKAYGSLSQPAFEALVLEAKRLSIPVAKHGPHPSDMKSWQSISNLQSLEHVEDIYQGPLKFKQDSEALEQAIKNLAQSNTPVTPTLAIFWQLTQISKNKKAFMETMPEGYISPYHCLGGRV